MLFWQKTEKKSYFFSTALSASDTSWERLQESAGNFFIECFFHETSFFLADFPFFTLSSEWVHIEFIYDSCHHPSASVNDMIQELGWQTLEQQRTSYRLTLLYKMSHDLVDIDVDYYLSRHNKSRTRGSHNYKYIFNIERRKTCILFVFSEDHKRVECTPFDDCWVWLSCAFPVWAARLPR